MNPKFAACGARIALGLLCLELQTGAALAEARLAEEFHQTYPLAAGGQVRLDNVNGKVHITTWERAEIQVDAVKHADSQADLDKVKIEIDSKPDQIRIHTRQPSSHSSGWKLWKRRSNAASVDYDIKVPAQVRLKDVENVNGSVEAEGVGGDVHVSTVNGRLQLKAVRGEVHASTVNGCLVAKGLAGDTKLETVNGAIEAAFDSLEGVKSVSAQTVNGKVELTLPANADAEVSATTLNGGIHGNGELTVKKNWSVGSELRGKLGKGGTQVRAETVNGGIRIHVAGQAGANE